MLYPNEKIFQMWEALTALNQYRWLTNRQMHDLLTAETKGRTGTAALKAMAAASRRYAKERPGLSAATFRSPIVESPEWMQAFRAVRQLFEKAFSECGLDEVGATHALRILRSLVRGFVEDLTGRLPVVWFNRPYLANQAADEEEQLLQVWAGALARGPERPGPGRR